MTNQQPSPSLKGQIADLRRLYMHLMAAGEWSHPMDTKLLSRAVHTLEELSKGGCRNNCMTAKENWIEGYETAMIDYHARPLQKIVLEAESSAAWKRR